jgi:hypothetical protein
MAGEVRLVRGARRPRETDQMLYNVMTKMVNR